MIRAGRDLVTLGKSILYQQAYQSFHTIKIDTTEQSVSETVDEVLKIINA
jgi:broad-specificity NMP kinase